MDPHLIHGDPSSETRAGSPVQSKALEARQQRPRPSSRVFRLRQPAGAGAGAAATAAQLVPGTHGLRCIWATGLVALRWPTNPKRGARALGILAWSLDGCGLGALGWLPRGPANHSPKSEKASKVITAAEMDLAVAGPGSLK